LNQRFKISGHHTSGDELADEIYTSFLGPGNAKDLLTFYCWLEWRDDFDIYGWLNRMDPEPDDFERDVGSPPRKRGKKVFQSPQAQPSSNSERVDESEIIRNNALTQSCFLETLRAIMDRETVAPTLPPETLALTKARYDEEIRKMLQSNSSG
jgi:hypothetical protein